MFLAILMVLAVARFSCRVYTASFSEALTRIEGTIFILLLAVVINFC